MMVRSTNGGILKVIFKYYPILPDTDFPKMEWKRNQGLVPFPRVGRSDNQLRRWSKLAMQQDMDKRTGVASANSGLWFGPRLGRIQKRAADAGEHF